MRSTIQLMLKRTIANWRLLSAVIIGSILAGTIMSATVVYFESLRDIALQKELADQNPADLDILIEADQAPINNETHAELTSSMESLLLARVGRFTTNTERAMRSWTFFVDEPPELVPLGECPCRPTVAEPDSYTQDDQPLIECDCRRIQCLTVPEGPHVIDVVAGRAPEINAQSSDGSDLTVEGLLDEDTAAEFGLQVGDVIPARPHWDEERINVNIRLTGLYRRTHPDAPEWRIFDQAFGSRSNTLQIAQFVLPQQTMLEVMGVYFPNMGAEYAWFLDVEPTSIHATDTQLIRQTLEITANELRSQVDGFVLDTELDQTLLRYEIELFFNRLPMFIVLILIVLVVVYYTATLAGLLIEAQSADVALLRGRGTTSRQLLLMFAVETIIIAAFAIVLGPFLATWGVSFLGTLPFFGELNGGEALPVNLTQNVYTMAGIGSVMIMIALMIPAMRVTRQGVIAERAGRTRPQRLAFIQRYYLDIGFLAVVLFLFWQLTQQGSFVATDIFGETTVNQVILAVPALFLVAAGVVLLRIFPLAMDLLGRLLTTDLVSRIVSPAVVLGIWQMARNPAHYSRVSLLLIMTAGLGVFAASFAATLERSARDQVLYDTGGDIRVPGISNRPGGRSFNIEEDLQDVKGIDEVTTIYRLRGSITAGFNFDQFSVLAVDPDEIGDIAWHRSDFTREGYDSKFQAIGFESDEGIPLPADARFLTARVKPLFPMPDVRLIARLSDANDRFYSIDLGLLLPESRSRQRFPCDLHYADPDNDEFPLPSWCRIGASVQPAPFGRERVLLPVGPLKLHSIGVATFDGSLNSGAFDIDDISTVSNDGTKMYRLEFFDGESNFNWNPMRPTAEAFADTFDPSPLPAGEAENPGIMRLRWGAGQLNEFRGISSGSTIEHIPVLASESLLDKIGAKVGETLEVSVDNERTSIDLVGTIDYFPTLNPEESSFVIMDIDAAHNLVNARRHTGERIPNEAWIKTEAGTPSIEQLEIMKDEAEGARLRYSATSSVERNLELLRLRSGPVSDRLSLLAGVSVDPLVSEGWRALLGVAFVTVLIVSAIGFVVHTRVAFRRRLAEFALLRTIGLSMRQLLMLILLEQLIVIGVAVAIGIFMGTRLGDTIIPYLARSGQDANVVPPMTLEIYWTGFVTTFGLLAIVFAVVIAISLISVYTMAIHRVMRMGDA